MKNKYLVLVNKNSIMTNFYDYEIITCNSAYANDRYLEKKHINNLLNYKNILLILVTLSM